MKAKVLFGLLFVGTILVLALFSTENTGSTQLFKKHATQQQFNTQELNLEGNSKFSVVSEQVNEKLFFDQKQSKIILGDNGKELKVNKNTSVWNKQDIAAMNKGKVSGTGDFVHKCAHDRKLNDWNPHFEHLDIFYKQHLSERKIEQFQHKEASDWQPIRFVVNYDNIMNSGLSEGDIKFIKDRMIPAAKAYFESTFFVHRLESPIIPSKYYTNNKYKCNGEVDIPQSIYQGVQNADMIMLITAGYDEGENYLAYASKCHQYEKEIASGRPTIGFFRINASYLSESLNAQRWFTWVETAIHEMMHAMGFSSHQFKKFLNNGGQTGQINGQNFFMGRNTVKFGQEYFNCQNFNGVPLEQNGGSGSAGSHWERTALGNEGMTASDFGDAVYSKFTLNLFRDSGWYEYNESNAQHLAWARGGGCKTMQGQCDKSIPEHTCTVGNGGCSFDYSASGVCVVQDSFAPDCPFYMGYSNGNCQHGDFMVSRSSNLGGAVNYDSRCWNVKSQTYGYTNLKDACFESKCVDGKVSVKVDGVWKTCASEGSLIKGKKVVIECPEVDTFCTVESNCDNSCTAQGTCINGTCQCYNGYTGDSCQEAVGEEQTSDAGSGETTPDDGYKKYYGTQYCASQDYLLKYGDNQYLCCNDSINSCCGLYQEVSSNYCYCINNLKWDYYQQRCL